MKSIIAASILSSDFLHLENDIHALESGGADWIHVDVMDGQFVPNITMGPFIVEHCRRITNLPIDVHLMIERPERHIDSFVRAGACLISVHQETCPHLIRTLDQIRVAGANPGVVLNPGTNIETLREAIPYADYVLLMSVNPGFSGQVFIPSSLNKIQRTRLLLNELNPLCRLEVDGGINAENIAQVQQSGADTFVAANAIFNHQEGISAGIHALRKGIK